MSYLLHHFFISRDKVFAIASAKGDVLRYLILLLAATYFVIAVSTSHAQNVDEVSPPEDDKSSTSEKQRELTSALEAANRFRQAGDALNAARALNRAGRLQLRLNLPQKALATYKEASTVLNQTSPALSRIDNLNGLGTAYNYLSKCGEAKEVLQNAIALSEQEGYAPGKAEALVTLSDCQNYGDHLLALKTAKEGLDIWLSLGDKREQARALVAIGDYHLAQGDLVEATSSYESALNLSRELGSAGGQGDALIGLGFVEFRKGAWHSSFTFLTQAEDLTDENAEPYKKGQIAAGLASIFIEVGVPEKALVQYNQALIQYREVQNPRAVFTVMWGLGKSYYSLANYPEALQYLQNARAGAEAIKETAIAALCDDFLGRVYDAMGESAMSIRHFESALELSRSANPPEAARVRALMGKVYARQGQSERARKLFKEALESFRAFADQVNQSATLYALGSLEFKQNNSALAEDYLRQSIDVTENMRLVPTSRDLTAAFSATVHERYESYIECLMRKHKAQPGQNFDVRAFETSELSRGRALVELLQATQTALAPGLDSQLAEQEKTLRQSLRVKEDSKVALLGSEYKKEDLAAVEGDIAELEAQYKQVLDTIRSRYPSFEQINRPTGWDVRQIQEKVVADDETLLLEYSLGADRSYVWAITRDRITSYELPSETLINEAAQKVYKLLATHPSEQSANELDLAVRELSQLVLSPVATDLNKRRIVIVADGALNYIPFQILPAPSVDRQQLVVTHEVINAPSASILGQLREETVRRQPAKNTLAAFGDPVYASNYAQQKGVSNGEQLAYVQTPNDDRMRTALRDIELNGDSFDPSVIQPLFYAKLELANLREVAGNETLLATGFDATREKLQSTDLTKYAVLHFATHGVLDPRQPENSGLFLSTVDRNGQTKDGFVGLFDIYNLHAPVDVVVLSACRTGLGKDVRGEGLIGITRGFMYAGASSVVASLWKVDDEATAELMKRFYTNLLKGGMTPAAALAAAQNSIRQQEQWRSPYYWAAFTIQGDYRGVIKATRTGTVQAYENIAALGALLALMVIVGWSYRRHVREMTQERR